MCRGGGSRAQGLVRAGVAVQGELVRARGFRSRAFNSALARLAGCRARGGLPQSFDF